MDKKEIVKEIKSILKKISKNNISAWEHDLKDTRQVVVLEDFNSSEELETEETKYNGWLEDLCNLMKKLDK